MSIAAARQGIADALVGCDIAVYRRLTDVVDPPAAVIGWPESIDPRVVFETHWQYAIPVLLCVSYADPDAADTQLEAMLANVDATPFYALDNARNLDGGVSSTSVVSVGDFGTFEAQGITLFGCRVFVEVFSG